MAITAGGVQLQVRMQASSQAGVSFSALRTFLLLSPLPAIRVQRVVPHNLTSFRVFWLPLPEVCTSERSRISYSVGYTFNASATWGNVALVPSPVAAASVQVHASSGMLYTRVPIQIPVDTDTPDTPLYFWVCAFNEAGASALRLHPYQRPFSSAPVLVSLTQLPGSGAAQSVRVSWMPRR
jgi:hypothetical protein